MNLSESCNNWTMSYDGPEITNLTPEEKMRLCSVLHNTGDLVAIVSTFNHNEEIRRNIVTHLHMLVSKFRDDCFELFEQAMDVDAWHLPLEDKYNFIELFGTDLHDEILKLLATLNFDSSEIEGIYPIDILDQDDFILEEFEEDEDPDDSQDWREPNES